MARVISLTSSLDPDLVAARLKRDADGLVGAVVQQHDTGEVLMLGWMDDEALRRTLTDRAGDVLEPQPAGVLAQGRHLAATSSTSARCALDCDGDALLVRSTRSGAACHTGDRTCFDAGDLAPSRRWPTP